MNRRSALKSSLHGDDQQPREKTVSRFAALICDLFWRGNERPEVIEVVG
jgi:hypothetical protein